MHFEFLVEDQSGKAMLERLVPKLLEEGHTYVIHAYKGIGRIPKGLTAGSDPEKRILLDQLPRLLRGYGKAFARYPENYKAAVVVICDLDERNLSRFTKELLAVAAGVEPCPSTKFCIAVEEGEAWFLGDGAALLAAYPKAKKAVLNSYVQDSICGTWETLANAIYPGGSEELASKGFQVVGLEKHRWAESITPHMDPAANVSPSFKKFCKSLEDLTS